MNVYVLNTEFERIAIIDAYTSIIWTNRYCGCGDFELYIAASEELLTVLCQDYYLIREGHEENAMIIEKIQVTTDSENGNYLLVSGRCLKSIVYRRIIWHQTNITGTLENAVNRLLDENIIAPASKSRKIDGFINKNTLVTGVEVNTQSTGENLGEFITALCLNYGIAFDVKLNLDDKTFEFVLYKGSDRSYNQETLPWVVFSPGYENLLASSYSFDTTNYKNICKVAGEGEGIERKNTQVGDASGLNRREIYVDARDLSTNNGEVSDTDYYKQLEQRGNENLAENTKVENIEGEVIDFTYCYGEDYFLGDVVEVVNDYDMQATSRVLEVIESEDESGSYTIPVFSSFS